MRRVLWIVGPLLLFCWFLPASAPAQTKMATVDLRKVFDNYWKRKQADAAIKEEAGEMEKENVSMMEDYNKAKDEYKTLLEAANDQAISSEERDKRKRACDDKLRQLKEREDIIAQYQKSARTKIDERLRRTRENILSEIRHIINAKAQAAGYSIVFDSASETPNGTPVVLYLNNRDADLTDSVLEQLNMTAPPDAAAPAADAKK